MREYSEQKITTTHKITESLKCDKCGREADLSYHTKNDVQEFFCVSIIGGYHSIFGDGETVKLDLCQWCVKEIKRGPIPKPEGG